jgi:hypothetical protein
VPEPGETLSQLPPEVVEAEAVQFSVLPPVLVMFTVWFGGLPPVVELKVRAVGLRPMVGGAVRVSVTATVCGELVAPAAVMVIVPL